ncbi:hypothetical protein GCM10010104_40850 [Streptomyces indiaensis]|uniref:Uncharacterized protein n=1 Tax=Streptomyces indiaensis TaxID=284033 RepID=A0ABN3DTG0_9ACTN
MGEGESDHLGTCRAGRYGKADFGRVRGVEVPRVRGVVMPPLRRPYAGREAAPTRRSCTEGGFRRRRR